MARSTLIFKKSHVFLEKEDNPSNKVVTVEEELDGIDIDGIGNLVALPTLVFINEECGNLKLVVDGADLTRNINRKRKSGVFQAYRCPLCHKCYRRD